MNGAVHLPENCPGPDIDPDTDTYHQSCDESGRTINGYWCWCGAGWYLEVVDGQWTWLKQLVENWAHRQEHDDFERDFPVPLRVC